MAKPTQQRAKGPDNNHRLAALESGVSTLSIALAQNGFPVAADADPIVVAIGAIKAAAENREHVSAAGGRIEQLEHLVAGYETGAAELEKLANYLLENRSDAIEGSAVDTAIKLLEGTPPVAEESGNATAGEIAAIARADAAEAKLAELQEAIGNGSADEATAALESRIDELEREGMAKDARIKDLESGAPIVVQTESAAVDETPEPAPRERSESARDVGPDYGGRMTSDELTALLASGAADGLEIAFSNGDYEIVTLQPVPIAAIDLQKFENRHVVGPAISVRLQPTDVAEELRGFGLMLGGEQIAYCPTLEPTTLEPGVEHQFQRAIFF